METGIAKEKIRLKRDPSPVTFGRDTAALLVPKELRGGSGIILYSGNWGVAHDDGTFVEAYEKYRRQSQNGLTFWLNAVGAKVNRVESRLRHDRVPFYRSSLVTLQDLPSLLVTADVHLITLRDGFVGYVLPSKIHACIESGKRIVFIGSASSDVHLLASKALLPAMYYRVDVGDVEGLVNVFHTIEYAIRSERGCDIRQVNRLPPSPSAWRAETANPQSGL
jgi:hypothetical protein